jgi:anti-sigma factor RsiW
MKEKENRQQMTNAVEGTPSSLSEDTPLSPCGRALDLVAYLYGEADEATAESFEAHTLDCAACRAELTAFRQVRVNINDWREQALGALAAPTRATGSPVNVLPNGAAAEPKRSAARALREFFTLAPMWMRAATATLALVFCALVVLTITHYSAQPKVVTVEKLVPVKPSDQELSAMVDEALKRKGAVVNSASKEDAPAPDVVSASLPLNEQGNPKAKTDFRRDAARRQTVASGSAPKLRISTQESREIARDLRLVASNDEEDLPRLSDLLGESN